MKFKSEEEMSFFFYKYIKRKFNKKTQNIVPELSGIFGRPDYVIYEKKYNKINFVISYELKLKNWNRALKQAYRYKAYSNLSYVILDDYYKSRLIKNIDAFKQYNIGLKTFNKDGILETIYEPFIEYPYSKSCSIQLANKVLGKNKDLYNKMNFIKLEKEKIEMSIN